MDNSNITSSIILKACKLARELESNLANHSLASLSDSCHHIIQAFSDALHHLNSNVNIYSQPMQKMQMQLQLQQPIIMDVSSSSADHPNPASSTSSQRPRTSRRKVEDGDRRTIEVEAGEYGNTEIPPDDGFTWKKYGQKEILGCLFPRSYYRCTHQKLYNCPAKKQVQRLHSSRPTTYQLTYRGLHTCHLSPTAPAYSGYDPPVADMADAMFNSTSTTTIDLIFSSHPLPPINYQPDNNVKMD